MSSMGGTEGPSLHDFMAQDASFLSQLQRSEGDDYIEYRVYSDRTRKGAEVLEEVRTAIMAMASVLRKDHIWHREAFALEVVQGRSGKGGDHEAYLWGHTRVGENVEDEWVITYLLHTATAHPSLSKYGLSAYVTDADGHFLLIEAACELPEWLTPDCSDFRVWMREGCFHVLSPGHHPAPIPDADVALSLLRPLPSLQHQPTAAPWLDAALRPRFCLYPGAIQEQGHHACCLLPVSLAYALEQHPQLVANAARAFRLRDSSAMGTLNARGQTWRFSPSKCVLTRVRFSRYLYGQLQADEDVCPPRDFVAAVDAAGGLNGRGVSLGLKLACGAELAYRQNKEGHDERLEEQRHMFMRRMEAIGVFDGLTPGSKARKDKERIVRSEFERAWSERHGADTGEVDQGNSLHAIVDAVLVGGYDEQKEYEKRRNTEVPPDDDESWLEVSPDQLESLLRRYAEEEEQAGPAPKEREGTGSCDEEDGAGDEESEEGSGVEEIEELLRGMKAFMGTKSGVEGAELPGEKKGDALEDLDVVRLMKILRGEAGEGEGKDWMDEDSEDSEGSDEDDMEGGDKFSDEEETAEAEAAGGRSGEAGRVRMREIEGPDSDDDDEEEEEEEGLQDYMAAMDQELTASTMFQSFERMPTQAPARSAMADGQASQADGASAALGPVNLDLNLVKSLLDSVAMQGAEPGPVSTLLNEMARLQKG